MSRRVFSPPNDPALPCLKNAVARGVVIDKCRAVLPELTKDASGRLTDVNIEYFHHKPGTNCRIAYRFYMDDGAQIMACGEIMAPHDGKKPRDGKRVRYIPDLNMELRILPSDKALPGLKRIMSANWLKNELRLLIPKEDQSLWRLKKKKIKISVVSYRPRFRCLVKIDAKITDGRTKLKKSFYAKVHSTPLSEEIISAIKTLCSKTYAGPLIIPSVSGVYRPMNTLVLTAISARPFLESLDQPDDAKIIKRLSRSLLLIHTTSVPIKKTIDLPDHINDMENAVSSLAELDPTSGRAAKNLCNLLLEKSFHLKRQDYSLIHGDFSHEQVLVKGKRIVIVDFDCLAIGDYRQDLGNFGANLLEKSIGGDIDQHVAISIFTTFINAYQIDANRGYDAFGLKWYTAYSLLKLAVRPLRRAEPGWRKRALAILKMANLILTDEFNVLLPEMPQAAVSEPRSMTAPRPEIFDLSANLLKLELSRNIRAIKIWPARKQVFLILFAQKGKAAEKATHYGKLTMDGESEHHLFPEDPGLKKLPQAMDKKVISRYLENALIDVEGFKKPVFISRIRVVSYKPERRCQIEYHVRLGSTSAPAFKLYGKLYNSLERSESAYENLVFLKQLAQQHNTFDRAQHENPFRIPELKAVFVPEIKGKSFYNLLRERPSKIIIEKIASGLKAFHNAKPPFCKDHFWVNELEILTKWISVVEFFFPLHYGAVIKIYETLAKNQDAGNPVSTGIVHGDFYDKQVIVSGDDVLFIDFDAIAKGDPASDIGNFIAHLTLRGLQLKNDPDYFDPFGKKLISAYAGTKNSDFNRMVMIYKSATLLRLACVYALRPRGNLLFYPLLKNIEKILISSFKSPL
jgi:aminoglycoside phosphotransferase (APT) family kinase protein